MKICNMRKYVMIKCLYYIPKLFVLLSVIDMLTNYSVANKMYYGPVGLTLLNKHYYYYYHNKPDINTYPIKVPSGTVVVTLQFVTKK